MTWSAGSHPASTTLRSTLAGTLTTAGFTRVTQDYLASANFNLDVWKSAAAGNSASQDWYLFLGELTTSGNRQLFVSVAEGWDDSTKQATKYIPVTNNVAPAADFSVGATGVAPTQAICYYLGTVSFVDTTGATYRFTATPDRVMLSVNASSPSVYAGLADRIHDVTLDPVTPLVLVQLDGNSSFYSAPINTRGGSTREPGQSTANANNFRTFLSNQTSDGLYTMTTDSLGGRVILQPLRVATSRTGYPRAVLKDVRGGVIASGNTSDTAVETLSDGVTTVNYVNFQPFNQVARFVPQV